MTYYPAHVRCPSCDGRLCSDDIAQYMPFNIGVAIRALWQAAAGDEDLAVLHTAAEHVQREITRCIVEQERVMAKENDAQALSFPEEKDDRVIAAPVPQMAWARRDCDPVTLTVSLGNRTCVMNVEGDLRVGMVTDTVATKAPFQLPESGRYSLAYADGGQLRTVGRDVRISDLAAEEGHESRRYIILTLPAGEE